MPLVSMFYGIIIRLNTSEHNPPHFHASYGEYNAVFSLDGELQKGEMPRTQLRMIQAWVEIHKDELKANWDLASNDEPIFKIEPLK